MIPKFKVWHKERKEMFDVTKIDFEEETIGAERIVNGEKLCHTFSFGHVELMQSTVNKKGKKCRN